MEDDDDDDDDDRWRSTGDSHPPPDRPTGHHHPLLHVPQGCANQCRLYCDDACSCPKCPDCQRKEPHEAVWLAPGTWHRGPIPLAGERGTYLTVQQLHTDTLDHETREPDAA